MFLCCAGFYSVMGRELLWRYSGSWVLQFRIYMFRSGGSVRVETMSACTLQFASVGCWSTIRVFRNTTTEAARVDGIIPDT